MAEKQSTSRRNFIKTTAAVSAAATLASLGTNFAHAAASDKIRVGLIGCGGRGKGAARDCVGSAENVQLVALGDMFEDHLKSAREGFVKDLGDKQDITDDRCFTGFDAYKKVLACDIDLAILTTPPGFRAMHIAAAVDAGKHIFAEKPVAVDPAGVRSVIASAEKCKEKKLAFVAGTQRRHQKAYIETIKRIHDGAIGDVVAAQVYWNQGGLWKFERQPEWSDMEWQLRNWYYFAWLSGDHIVEQHVHQLDVMNWVFGANPVSAYGMGGRQVRTAPVYGHIFDHFTIEYTYPNGAKVMSMCRQIDGTDARVSEHVVGTKGHSDPGGWIKGANAFRFESEDKTSPYSQEHTDLIASIRSGNPLNEAKQVAESSLVGIMGRMSAYTGKEITWEQAMKSELNLMPSKLEFGPISVPAVAVPGKDRLV